MTHDPLVSQQPLDICIVIKSHAVEIEPVKGCTKILSLAQDRQPRQAGLETFKADFLKQTLITRYRNAPLIIVIGDVIRQLTGPETAHLAISTDDQAGLFLHRVAHFCPPKFHSFLIISSNLPLTTTLI